MAYTRHQVPFAAGSETSFEAALYAQRFVSRQGLTVYRWLATRGAYGGTQLEASIALGISRPSLCARFKALQDAGAIAPLAGTSRERCAVYVELGGGQRVRQLSMMEAW